MSHTPDDPSQDNHGPDDHRHDDRGHHGHAHGHGHDLAATSQSRVFLTFWLIAVFMIVEAVGGWWTGSLTLVADAGHMLTDSGALALAWFATRATRRPSDAERSYGHHRFSVLSALINGLGLIAITGWIAIEAVQRLIAPEAVKAVPMLAIAVTGFLVNAGAFFLLHGADRDNLNIKGALLHVIGDLLASLAAIVAATVIILMPSWTIADPILSVIAGGLILRGALGLVRRSWHVLMEATPEEVNVGEIAETLEALDGVTDIHHLHAWSLVPGKTLITLHAQLAAGHTSDAVLARIKQTLAERFRIDHSTIQIEGACADDQDHRDDAGAHAPHDHDHGHGHGDTHKRKVAASR
jgi:cobalt-zinc-cadmium efflux system protein